jgi:hypothetical protein
MSHHATYSGSEGVLIMPSTVRVAPEQPTADVSVGDLAYTWFQPGDAHGVTEVFSEIAWFYDVDARPSMHEGPAPMTVFAQIEPSADDFYAVSRQMRRSGVTGLAVELLDPDAPFVERRVAFRSAAGAVSDPLLARAGDELVVAFTEHSRPDTAPVDPRSRALVGRSLDRGLTWTVEEAAPHTSGSRAIALDTDGDRLVLRVAVHRFEASAGATGWVDAGSDEIVCPVASGPVQLAVQADVPVPAYPNIPAGAGTAVTSPDGRAVVAYAAWDGPLTQGPPAACHGVHIAMFSTTQEK